MTLGPVVGHARVNTNMSFNSSSLKRMGDRMAKQLSSLGDRLSSIGDGNSFGDRIIQQLDKIGTRNGRIYRDFGKDAVLGWRLALGAALSSAPWIGGAVSAMAGTLTMAAGALYSLGQSAFAAYPLLGSLAVAGATFAVGMRGFMDAVKATDAEELADALANLSPSAADSAMAIRGLSGAARRLRMSVQETMFSGLSEEISKLNDTLFPVLETGMTKMAGALNLLGESVLDYANSTSGLEVIGDFLDNSANIFGKLQGAVVPFLDGLLRLFNALSPAGERLADRIVGVAEKFQTWTSAEGFGDRIDNMMKRAEKTAGLLFDVIGNIGGILSNVFGGANSETNNFLETLRDITQQFEDWTGSVEGQEAIQKWAEDANRVMDQVGRTLESVFNVFKELASADAVISFLQTVGDAFDFIGKLPLADMVAKFVELAEVFRPIAGPMLAFVAAGAAINIMIGNVMGQIGGFVGAMVSGAKGIGGFIGKLTDGGKVTGFTNILTKLGGVIAKGFKIAGIAGLVIWIGTIVAKSDELKAKLGTVWDAVKNVFSSLGEAFSGVSGSAGGFLESIQPIVDVLEKIAGFVVGIVFDTLAAGINAVASVISGVGTTISGFIDLITGLFQLDPNAMLEGLTKMVSGIGPILSGAWTLFWNFFAPAKLIGLASKFFKGIITGIRTALPGIGTAAGGIFNSIMTWIKRLPGQILIWITNAVNNVLRWLETGATKAGEATGRLVGKIVDWILKLPARMWDIASEAVSKLKDAISGAVGKVGTAAKSIFDKVVEWITKLPERLKTLGKNALTNFVNAVEGAVSNVRLAASEIFNTVKDAISGRLGEMLSIGGRIVENIGQGIRNGIDKVTGAVRWVTDKIRGFFPGSPVQEGPLTAWNTGASAEGGGRNLLDAIAGGLSDPSRIRRAMVGIANEVKRAANLQINPSISATTGAQSGISGSIRQALTPSTPVPSESLREPSEGSNGIVIENLSLNVDAEQLSDLSGLVEFFQNLTMTVRQGVRVGV